MDSTDMQRYILWPGLLLKNGLEYVTGGTESDTLIDMPARFHNAILQNRTI